MAAYGFIGLLYCFKLFKNHSKNSLKKVFSLSNIFEKYKILFLDKLYISAIFILAIENVILFLYYTAAPFIIQEALFFTPAQYGNIMLFSGLSYLLGNLINDRLLNKFECEKLIFIGLVISIVISLMPILILLFEKNNVLNIYIFTLPVFLIFMSDGLIFPNLMTKALESYAAFSGIAGGLLAGGLNILAAVIVAMCAHFIDLHNVIMLYSLYFVMLMISGVIFYKIHKNFIS